MRNTGDQQKIRAITRRTLVLGGGQLTFFGILTARLCYLQLSKSDEYRTLSQKNQFNFELFPPVRGRIFDRNGLKLAENRDKFRMDIIAEQTDDIVETLKVLGKLIKITNLDIKRVLSETKRKTRFIPVTVVENLSREDISRVAVNMPYLPGLRIEIGRSRRYPYGQATVHVTGYVAVVSEAELTGDPVLELPDFRIGKSGVEKYFDEEMRGTAGRRRVEVDARGHIIREQIENEGKPGRDITLTIDMRLQKMASDRIAQGRSDMRPVSDPRVQRLLDAGQSLPLGTNIETGYVNIGSNGRIETPESGAAVVMDIHRGDILAMASVPGFDPNLFSRGLSPADWDLLLSNPRAPMTNKVVTGEYSPGSTFKMLVCLAALEAGLINPGTRFTCHGRMKLGKATFHCWKKYGHGQLDMLTALEESCDIYLYELSLRLGIDRIAAIARRFGFGTALGISLPGEREGLVPTPDWKQTRRGKPWQKGETLITGIGQGALLCTPLQLATMTARLANGGLAVVPRLVRDVAFEQPEFPSLNFKDQNLQAVLRGMDRVVNGRRGTARSARLADGAFRFGAKTGSVQVKRITKSDRRVGIVKNEDRPWQDRDHALFVAYAPLDAPRYAVAVVVEHGGSGGAMAAPIGRDILVKTMQFDPARVTSGPLPPVKGV